ncbi:M3 family metallopeptidase [Microbulbifer hainanensis]|uniref:M3 family metallopeptidase n=1 Tax=Microbulbifer hainanensis TaxID=2735675 RepID=UPI001868D5A8|nr:M3 family metallopeptidase [Microbulbifer hainanensis]
MTRFAPGCIATSTAIALSLVLAGCGKDSAQQTQDVVAAPASAAPETSSLPPFDSITAEQLKAHCEQQFSELQASLQTLEKAEPPYTEEAFLPRVNRFEVQLVDALWMTSTLEEVHPDEKLRETATDCVQSLNQIATDTNMSRPLYDRALALSKGGLADDSRRYVEKNLQDLRLNGVDKSEEVRAKLKTLSEEILATGQEFARNIRDDVRSIKVEPERLAGLPEDYIAAHPAGEDGLVTITTRYPDLFPVADYAEDDALRRELYTAFQNRAYPQNKAVLEKLLQKRYEKAQLLGFDNFADLYTAGKMVGNGRAVREFIDLLSEQVRDGVAADRRQLLARLREINPDADVVQQWQTRYLKEKIRQQKYDVDSRELRQYFAYGQVRDGIFGLVSDLFDVQFKPWDTAVWHPSVEAYEMWSGDTLVGRFFLDMHPREGKYQHAAAFPIQIGIEGQQQPVAALVCNFPGEKDPAELMEFTQVETFLHEFGHLIHAMFGGHQRWAGISGIATEWDFVEAPSQMLEEWIWDKPTLQSFAINGEGEVLPDALFDKMYAARDFALASNTARQLNFAALSYNLYSGAPTKFDLDVVAAETAEKYSPFPPIPDTHFYTSFGHLDGYGSNYYTYQWSLAIAQDMFSRFEREGLRNKQVAAEYRDRVLAAGGLKPAAELVRDFLGRDYTVDAYVQRLRGESAEPQLRAELETEL